MYPDQMTVRDKPPNTSHTQRTYQRTTLLGGTLVVRATRGAVTAKNVAPQACFLSFSLSLSPVEVPLYACQDRLGRPHETKLVDPTLSHEGSLQRLLQDQGSIL